MASPCFLCIALLLAAPLAVAGDKYAVLVAGSNGYSNYRHQADIAHAYTLLRKGGIPASNIITMMYDDVAHSLRNKHRGKLYNHPDGNGTTPVDVYAALDGHIDYKRGQVTPKNFIKVLTADGSADGRVLASGPEDDVFVYFADHGGVGLLAFPQGLIPGFGPVLHADELHTALQTMATKQKFRR